MASSSVAPFNCRAWRRQRPAARASLRVPAMLSRVDVVTFGLIVDDLYHADGRTSLGLLGGGGSQTLWGLLVHPSSPSAGLAGRCGDDLPPSCAAWLQTAGVDVAGLELTGARATPRARQATSGGGLRTQTWVSPPAEVDLYPRFERLPPSYAAAGSYHIGVHPSRPDLETLSHLRAAAAGAAPSAAQPRGGLVSVETYTCCDAGPLSSAALASLVASTDVFSPNEAEAASMLGFAVAPRGDAEAARGELLAALLRAAAGRHVVLALRCGAGGARVVAADTGIGWAVPAYPGTAMTFLGFVSNASFIKRTSQARSWWTQPGAATPSAAPSSPPSAAASRC